MSKHESELALERRARESGGLLERLEESRRRIGKMCSERRGPRMTIPVNWADDDFFICLAIEDAIAALKQPAATASPCQDSDGCPFTDDRCAEFCMQQHHYQRPTEETSAEVQK